MNDECYKYLLSEYVRVRDELLRTQDLVIKLQGELCVERTKWTVLGTPQYYTAKAAD